MAADEVTLVMLAGGRATRFGGVKQLAPVGPTGEALMDYTVYDAVRAGYTRLILVTNAAIRDALTSHAAATYAGLATGMVVQDESEVAGAPPGLWGTGHAVLAAAAAVRGPFAVCNADDHYGRAALAGVLAHLLASDPEPPPTHCVAGYRLAATLATSGGVSRAVCTLAGSLVTDVAEVRHAVATAGGVNGELADGTPVSYRGDEQVSMNLWGFRPEIIPPLAAQFCEHCSGVATPASEFYLSNAVGAQVRSGTARLRCIPCPDDWFGMTYAADAGGVGERLAHLVAAGRYPAALAGGFTPGP